MNNELDIMNEAVAAPETPEVFAEQLIDTAVEAPVADVVEDDTASEAIALALAAEEAAEIDEEFAEVAEETACECCEAAEAAEETACECCEAAEVAEEAIEEDEEPVVAPVFDEDEEFVPAITFSDDYDDPVDDRDEDYYSSSNAARVRIHLTEEAEKKAAEPVITKKVSLSHKISNFVYHNKVALLIAAGVVALVALTFVTKLNA